jgi:hypothetical protein
MTEDGTETMTETYRICRKMWRHMRWHRPVLLSGEVINAQP